MATAQPVMATRASGATAGPAAPELASAFGGDRWQQGHPAAPSAFPALLLLAMALHALPFTWALRGNLWIGAKPDPLDGVTIELVDATEFDRRRNPSATPGTDRASAPPSEGGAPPRQPPQPTAPATAPSPPAPEAPPRPPAEEAKPAPPAKQDFADVLTTPLDQTFVVPEKQKKVLDLTQPPLSAQSPPTRPNEPQVSAAERYLDRRSRPSRSSSGEIDDFTRAIATSLERAKPVAPGVGGRVIVEFVVTETGRMEGLRVVQGSGQPKLDDLVMRAVARAQLIAPPIGASLRDRTFEITFSYK